MTVLCNKEYDDDVDDDDRETKIRKISYFCEKKQ